MCNMYVKFIIPNDRIMQWQNYFYYQEDKHIMLQLLPSPSKFQRLRLNIQK